MGCRNRWFADSALEGSGFELLVPRHESPRFPKHPCTIKGAIDTKESCPSSAHPPGELNLERMLLRMCYVEHAD